MPAAEYVATRSDGRSIGKAIRELVRLMVEEGMTWQNAADVVGLKRTRAYKALHKPHVIQYRRERRKELVELLSTRVPLKRHQSEGMSRIICPIPCAALGSAQTSIMRW
jgi:hypothetical protein